MIAHPGSPGAYALRLYQPGDDAALIDITRVAIREIGTARYSKDQVDAWAARHEARCQFAQRAADGAFIFVAVPSAGPPVAYALLEVDSAGDGHLDMLYCHPDHTRHGLADALLNLAEECARAIDIPRLYTEASELAFAAFERAGYAIVKRRDFTIEHESRSVAIHNFGMEKSLF